MTVNTAIRYGKSCVGKSEYPPGSNQSFAWEHVNRHWNVRFGGQPWCGAYAIDVAFHGGLKLPWQMVSVYYIEQWGRNRGRFHRGSRGIKKGDFVILFGRGVHVEVAASDGSSTGYWSLGGNTSSTNQWNGGGVSYQYRRSSQVYGYVRLHDKYPKPPRFEAVKFGLPKVPRHYYGRGQHYSKVLRPRIHNGSANWADQNNVARIQRWLKYLGYYKGNITGRFNEATHDAVRKYKKRHGYSRINGLVGPVVWRGLQKSVYNKRYG